MSLDGKTILIIGGSSGIGFATAQRAAKAGARLIIAGRDPQRLENAVAALREAGAEVTGSELNAADANVWAHFCDTLEPVHHVISMVGGAMGGGFMVNDDAVLREAIDGKFFNALHICKSVAAKVIDGGSITLTAGAGGRPHSASGAFIGNAAISLLVQGLAVELAPRLRVNAIAPTWMDTPLWRNVPRADIERTKAHFAGIIPLGRTAEPGDIADAYVFVMNNRFLTGQTLVLDGGLGLVA
ncbi:SDR family oxidoreductase [Pseudomonas silvicola]|nr:SDR family oxidoreductase [Pseudomonas silvicola]